MPQHTSAFLQHSPCINSKVLTSKQYHKKCVNDLFAALNKGIRMINQTKDQDTSSILDKVKGKTFSDRMLDLFCCSRNRFTKCTGDMITRECGRDAVDAMNDFVITSFGVNFNTMCPKKYFDSTKQMCSIMPRVGSDPKFRELSYSPLGKYVTTYLKFALGFDLPRDTVIDSEDN